MWPNNNFNAPFNQGFIPFGDDGSNGFFTSDQELISANQLANLSAFGQNQNHGAAPALYHQLAENNDINRMSSPASQSSQSGLANKVQLNARAAELKEKLRKRKEMPGGPRPDSATPVNTEQQHTKLEQGHPDTLQNRPTGTYPTGTTTQKKAPRPAQQIYQNRLPASTDDIAEMIAGISSASANLPVSTGIPGLGLGQTTEATKNMASHTKTGSHSSAEEGEITGNTPNSAAKKKSPGQAPAQKPPSIPSVSTATGPGKQTSPSKIVKDTQDRVHPEQPVLKGSAASAQKQRDARENEYVTARHHQFTGTEAVPARPNDQQTTGSEAVPTRPNNQLQGAEHDDADLRDWLQLTGWHDLDYRNRTLTRERRLAEIEQEKKQLEAAAQQDMKARHQNGVSVPPRTPMLPSAPALSLSAPSTTTDLAADSSTNAGGRTAVTASAGPKRERGDGEDDGDFPRASKYSRLDDRDRDTRHDNRPESSHNQRGRSFSRWPGRGDNGPRSRPTSPRRFSTHGSPHSRYDRGYRSSPPPPAIRRESSPSFAPEFGRRDDHLARRSSRVGGDYERHRPRKLDLGRRGDTRFFMVKSFSNENVYSCMQDGLWTTQIQNGEILTSAFAKCKHVILFFSVNASKGFQGYARMATAPSPDTPAPKWMKGLHWECTPPFRVEWICKTEMLFHTVHHIKNTFNEGFSVIVGKDGQEIEEQSGYDLVGEMDLLDDIKAGGAGHFKSDDRDDPYRGDDRGHGSPPRGGYRGRGTRGRGRGRGLGRGAPYFKREAS